MHLFAPTWLQAAAQSPFDPTMLVPFAGIALVFYFLLIRPQQKQQQKQKQMLATLRKGDQVLTQSGLFGKIHSIAEKEVVLEIANGVKVRWLKSQVAGIEKADESAEAVEKSGDKATEKKE